MDYTLLTSTESFGKVCYGVKIMIAVGGGRALPLNTDELSDVGYQAQCLVRNALISSVLAEDPEQALAESKDRAALVGLFEGPIFVEEVPNGYAPEDPYFKAFPWYVVTTTAGRFKVGWRKRVIHVEWTETLCKLTAEQLFPNENVTKHERVIHAWSLEKAQEYISSVLKAA
jgi:hypothetical protein